ncbi:biotin--protein ligase [Sphingomonas sp. Leaf24]|nr:biotin--protein ligase [Sphingomonas sp. Leaf5]KQM89517.1 biotin--protein ligase [Sphingomonas sp. Leaf24]
MTVRVVGETGSTNADLIAAAATGAEEGLWLRAERQSAGRGRLGRNWADGAGNLFASTIVRLRPHDPPAHTLTLVAAVALAEAVAAFAPGLATIKWPNDLMVGDAKLSGILLERSGTAVVIGFGVNLSSHPILVDRPTTGLVAEGFNVEPDALLTELRDRFAAWVALWRTGDPSIVRSAWETMAHPVGTTLRVRLPDGCERSGRFDGLEADGALRLIDEGGKPVIVHAGDVSA